MQIDIEDSVEKIITCAIVSTKTLSFDSEDLGDFDN